MSKSLQGRVFVVTGGSRGLGLAIARRLISHGAKVMICARKGGELREAKEKLLELAGRTGRSGDAEAWVCDVSQPDQVDRLMRETVARFGRLDGVISNAGIIQVGPMDEMSRSDFEEAMNVNFWGTYNATCSSLPHLVRSKEEQGGLARIVNITSIGGVAAVPRLLPYVVSKFAAYGFSQGTQAELARIGVKVTTVIPGLMRTGSQKFARIRAPGPEGERREYRWFARAATNPLVSISMERAARKIVRAMFWGRRVATLGAPAQLLRLAYGIMPGVVAAALAIVNRWLSRKDRGRPLRPAASERSRAA